eukprot:TRINITY_DN3067_c0_g2_i9.p1 TRINITY_DN3067_c0_g2~~TRINITY_DN3067_c0_g2_i9.p1  ORF type:complete len:634 (-),score=89.85 TRINITY_DN3067_c0_g2_i9:2800-4653(-)
MCVLKSVCYLLLMCGCVWSQKRPNFLIVMTDDQGHDDLGHYNEVVRTPAMDQFAERSVEFDNFYVSSLCAPTRASLLTGRHYMNVGVWGVHGGMDFINSDETTIAEVMRANGYSTGHFGKWHSGRTDGYLPHHRGFQISYSTELYNYYDSTVQINGEPTYAPGWVEDWLADRIIDFISVATEPFFILWTPMSIHTGRVGDTEGGDWVAPAEFFTYYQSQPQLSPDLVKVYAATEYFDSVFGRVMAALKTKNLIEDTVVMLFSDNGPLIRGTDHEDPPLLNVRVPSGMLREKGWVEENGVRTFLFVQKGYDGFAPRKVYSNVDVMDIFPTILEIAGISVSSDTTNKPIQGLSIVPLLNTGKWAYDDRMLMIHEVMKTGIKEDAILELDSNRQINKNQALLSAEKAGPKGWGIPAYTATKLGPYKFLKKNVFDLSKAHYETDATQIYDADLEYIFEQHIINWWQSLLDDSGSFRKPIFYIGYNGNSVSAVFPFAPIERTPGSITVDDYWVSGFQQVGDNLSCRVQVDTGGTYQITLVYEWNKYVGANMMVQVGTYSDIVAETAASVTGMISQDTSTVLGSMELGVTPQGESWEMKLTLLGLETAGEVFKSLSLLQFSRL